jgi:hypothetical protein
MSGIFFYSILIFILLSIFVPSIYTYAYKCFIGRVVLVLLIIYFSKHSMLLGLIFVTIIIITSYPLYEGFSADDIKAKDSLVTSNYSIKDTNKNEDVFNYFTNYYCAKDSNKNVTYPLTPDTKKLERWSNLLTNIEFETRPTPTCKDGWWKYGGECLQGCNLNSQERHPDGTCICNQEEPNKYCGPGFTCVDGRCTRIDNVSGTYETRPSPTCKDGWFPSGDECLQGCSRNDQTRHSDGTCICNQEEPNKTCGPGFSCVFDRCTRVKSGADVDSINLAYSNKSLQQVICNPDTSQYYQNYGNNIQQNIRTGSTTSPSEVDGCSANVIDENIFCGYWAAVGECSNNPAYMLNSCKASCNRVSDTTSTNNNPVYNSSKCLKDNFKNQICGSSFLRNTIPSARNVSNSYNVDDYLNQDGQWILNMNNQVCSS